MKRILSLISILVLVAMVSCVSDPLPVANIPSVSLGENGKGYRDNGTGEEGELMRTSVRLYGNYSYSRESEITEVGFLIGNSLEELGTNDASEYSASKSSGSFYTDVSDLAIDHTYYFCAFIKCGKRVMKSTSGSFRTKMNGYALVTGLSRRDEIIEAVVKDNGGEDIKKVGFCIGRSFNPGIYDTVISAEMNPDGTFISSLPTLEPASVYHIRAFADNGVSGNRISYSDNLIIETPAEKDILVVAEHSYQIPQEGGEISVRVSHNYPLDVDINVDWIQLIETKAAYDEDFCFAIIPNPSEENREGTITFYSKDRSVTQEILVYQIQKDAIVVSETDKVLESEAESFEIEVRHNVDFTVDLNGCNWIHRVDTKAMTTSTVRFSVDENTGVEDRSAQITVRNADTGLSETVTVTQLQKDALVIAKDSYTLENDGGEITIEVGHNVDFTVDISDGWITQVGTKSYVNDKLVFNVARNSGEDNREGTITFTSKDGKISQTVRIYQSQTNSLIVSETDKVLESEAGSFEIEVRHNVDFTVDLNGCSWIHRVDTKAMTTSTVKFSVDENTGVEDRSAQITVRSADTGLSETVTVTQLQKDALVIAKDNYTLENDGGEITIEVGHNVDFTVDISDDWITQVGTKSYVKDKLVFNVARNSGEDNREGTITFTSKNGNISQEVKIYQSQTNSLIVSETDKVLESAAGSFEIEVRHNVDFTVNLNGCSWIHRVDTKAMTTSTVRFSVDENTGVEDRSTQITVRNADTGLSETVTVTQLQKDALVIAKDSYTLDNDGGDITIEVGYNVDFTVDISDDWITQLGTKAYVNDKLVFNVARNSGEDNREGTITFTSKNGNISQEVKIYQSQTNSLIVSETDKVLESEAESFEIEVRHNVDFTVDLNGCNWIHRVDTKAMTTSTVRFSVDENTGVEDRSAQITVRNADTGLSETVTVTQLQKDALVIAKDSYTLENDGGEITIEVGHNVDFTVDISDGWITQVGTKSYVEDMMTFYVSENTGIEQRTGTISFVSKNNSLRQDVSVIQEGYTFNIEIPDANFKAYCVENFDTDGDGEISNVEALIVQDINVHTENIQSLQGIEHFTNLERLKCEPNVASIVNDKIYDAEGNEILGSLQLIDISHNVSLISLSCCYNQLKSLDICQNIKLQRLECSYNQLENMILPRTSTLNSINCSVNKLTTIDLSKTPELIWLDCDGNNLHVIDLSNNRLLTHLLCQGNSLSELNLSNNLKLQYLWCPNNNLTVLNIDTLPDLAVIQCDGNNLTSLNVSDLPALTELSCDGNNLSALDVSNLTALTQLFCDGNILSALDVSNLTALTHLSCGFNNLSALDVSKLRALTYLYCVNNKINVLDVSNLTSLTRLECGSNNLTYLDVSNNLNMSFLLTPGNSNLIEIWLKEGQVIDTFTYDSSISTIYYK